MQKDFEKYLSNYNYGPKGSVLEAVKYSILNPGKRIRPRLLLSLLKDYGQDYKQGFSAALAVEMIHNYSLIHDDLPAMDNDDFRRGKLSNHKVFGEDIAILAGDALLSEAFSTISSDQSLNAETRVKLISLLSQHAGLNGMIYGQQLDLNAENKEVSLADVDAINIYKTSQLITFSFLAAAIIANKEADIKKLSKLGEHLGLAFQIQDDIFDVTKSFDELGKEPSDEANAKSTYVKLLGLEKSQKTLDGLFLKCYKILEDLDLTDFNLLNLIKDIEERSN